MLWLKKCTIESSDKTREKLITINYRNKLDRRSFLKQIVQLTASVSVAGLANFDLGDGKQYDRYQGLKEMMPYAKAVSAKSHDFDEQGNETATDYRRMMKIVLDAGYHGYLGLHQYS